MVTRNKYELTNLFTSVTAFSFHSSSKARPTVGAILVVFIVHLLRPYLMLLTLIDSCAIGMQSLLVDIMVLKQEYVQTIWTGILLLIY